MSELLYGENNPQESTFWNDVIKYAAITKDESFVEEVAYLMVTLHRTGA
ncbi:MAG: hypothetical protein HKM23_06700 [Nitrosopumilus sp.]|nr:hypothetical protein [Nitrosopumilus sp.]NNL58043.1 hypothetical protein [Nitrosopumilus sp.]